MDKTAKQINLRLTLVADDRKALLLCLQLISDKIKNGVDYGDYEDFMSAVTYEVWESEEEDG